MPIIMNVFYVSTNYIVLDIL